MVYNHSFKNPGDGNFYLATESGVPKLHSYESFSYINVTVYQSGPDVIATLSGSFNTTAEPSFITNGSFSTYVYPGGATVAFSNITGTHAAKKYLWATPYLGDWGASATKYPTSKSVEQTAGLDTTGISFPDSYVRGTYFTNTMTFANTTLVELGYDRFETITRTLAGDSSVILTYTVVTPPTPTPTPTVSFSATPTPTSSPVALTPTPSPTLSVTPTPSQQTATFGLYGATSDGNSVIVGNQNSFDGGEYWYSWQSILSASSNTYANGQYNIVNGGRLFPIGNMEGNNASTFGTIFPPGPYWFKPIVSGTSGVYIMPPTTGKRKVALLGAGINGGGSINYTYSYKNTSTSQYYTTSGTITMDDWCAGSYSNTVAVSMNRRNNWIGGFQTLTTRIYIYELAQISAGYELVSVYFYNNTDGDKCRIISMAFE